MYRKPCTCPPFGDRSYEELVTFFGLLGKKEESKNCCEEAGWICPELDRALVAAKKRDQYKKRKPKDDSINNLSPSSRKQSKELRKRKLDLRS